MPKHFRTTRQIALYFAVFYSLATLALGLGIHFLGDQAVRGQMEQRVQVEMGHLEARYQEGGLPLVQKTLLRRDDRGVNNFGYLLVDQKGGRLGGELKTSLPALGWQNIEFSDLDGDLSLARALTVRLTGGARLTVAAELAPVEDLRSTTLWLFSLGTAAMLIGGIIGGFLLSRAIRSQLDAMNRTALAIIDGQLDQRIAEGSHDDEFRRLAVTLNTMLDRNLALIENLRQVSGDIAHDLRTPIARLRQRLERALALAPPTGAHAQELGKAVEDSDAILSLFNALLRISEVESGALRQYFRPMDLSAVTLLICESYAPVVDDSGRTLIWSIGPDIAIIGDGELVSQALVNLLENALRHTPANTRIQVTLEKQGGRTVLTVEDDGPGVPEDALSTLTRRFLRVDKARASPGFGLGLNIVQAIVTAHGGTLIIENGHPGLRATLDMPAAPGSLPAAI